MHGINKGCRTDENGAVWDISGFHALAQAGCYSIASFGLVRQPDLEVLPGGRNLSYAGIVTQSGGHDKAGSRASTGRGRDFGRSLQTGDSRPLPAHSRSRFQSLAAKHVKPAPALGHLATGPLVADFPLADGESATRHVNSFSVLGLHRASNAGHGSLLAKPSPAPARAMRPPVPCRCPSPPAHRSDSAGPARRGRQRRPGRTAPAASRAPDSRPARCR